MKIVAETADWDASIYATCPQTADGEFVDCVRVLLESVQPPYDGANTTTVTYFRALSNKVKIGCHVPAGHYDDDDAPDLNEFFRRNFAWLLSGGAAGCVLAGYLVAKLCRRLRRSRDRRSWGGDEPPSKCSRFFDACKLRLVAHGAGGAGERPS